MPTNASRYQLPEKKWPFGRATTECPSCHGGGANFNAMMDYVRSTEPSERMTTFELRCRTCDGRGLVIADEAQRAS